MKKTTMLITMLIIFFVTKGSAQTLANMLDTVAAYSPHAPALARWSSTDGKKWWGFFDVKYKHETQDTVIAWINAYPTEAEDYYNKIGTYVNSTDPSSFSSDADKDAFYDLHARWIMIHAND